MVEKTSNLYIKTLQLDKGKEYMLIALTNYCEETRYQKIFDNT